MKKLLSLMLTIIIVSLSATSVFAVEKSTDKRSHFNSFTGTVKEIRKSENDADSTYVLLENKEGSEAYLILNKDTYFINDEEIIIGSEVTGYYDANSMMIMIYPPQYVAVVVMVSNKKQNIKVDLFDKNLISADNSLMLNINQDTKVVLKNGKDYKGDLTNRKLAVFYGASTRSIPAQTNPDKVVVLSDQIVPDTDGNSYYGSFTGTVTKMTTPKNDKGRTQLTLKDKDGLEALFTITKDTYQTNREKISVGSVVTGYYDAKVFRIMIYPAQYEAEVVDVEIAKHNVKVDYFDNKLISADNMLTIKIGNNTELIYMDGSMYKGKPVKTNLVVIYDKSTRSIPAQTEPIKVIVLEQKNKKVDAKDTEVKDKGNANWKGKLDEWMKLTDELFNNMDEISEYKDEIYKYIWKLMNKRDYSWLRWFLDRD
ncbi:MAG: hypothetical protein PHC56_05515 [Herbinix sp.]|nr:hypothetical protein [Herbinix sp.]